jgi:hypothetical protein
VHGVAVKIHATFGLIVLLVAGNWGRAARWATGVGQGLAVVLGIGALATGQIVLLAIAVLVFVDDLWEADTVLAFLERQNATKWLTTPSAARGAEV